MDMKPEYNLEAEISLIGGCLKSFDWACEATLTLTPLHFFAKESREVFTLMLELSRRDGEISFQSLDALAPPSSKDFLLKAYLIGSQYADRKSLIETLKKAKDKRDLLQIGLDLFTNSQDQKKEPNSLIQTTHESLNAISDGTSKQTFYTAKDILDTPDNFLMRYQKKQEAYRRGETVLTGIPTGFLDLDKHISGLTPGHLTIVGARPSVGKTTFATNLLQKMYEKKTPSIFFSLEMPKQELIAKLVCQMAKIDYKTYQSGSGDAAFFQAMVPIYHHLSKNDIVLYDDQPSLSIDKLHARVGRAKRSTGIKVVFIDYLQLLKSNRKGTDVRHLEIADISRTLKEIAKENDVCIVALAQLNRESEKRDSKRPYMSDLRESGSIEADADEIILLHRPEIYNAHDKPGLMEILVAKNRFGSTGSFYLNFAKASGHLTDYIFEKPSSYTPEPKQEFVHFTPYKED